MDMNVPLEEITKVGGSSLSGAGIMAVLVRFLRGDVKQLKMQQDKDRDDLNGRISNISSQLNSHALMDAQMYATRSDLNDLRNHIDGQFTEQRNFLVGLVEKIK